MFHVDPNNEGESSLIGEGAECHTVQVTSLDTLFPKGLSVRPRVIKIDVEGVEMSVLEGGQRFFESQPPDMVICEINRGAARNGDVEWDIRGFFKERGYRCALINLGSVDAGLNLRGGRFYATVPDDRLAAPDCPYVFNLMFLRNGSDLYQEDVL
ncbi:MAG: FkbM family methyltransferase [Rhodocyclaceae bacterium]|nr:FkbM family methyltransferase [Rhodocyclaceae bacterium]